MLNNKFRPDGSYDLWDIKRNDTTTSTWLTAYVAKILILAMDRDAISREGGIRNKVVKALEYLKSNYYETSMSFQNNGYSKDPYQKNSIDSEVYMTAHVLITFLHYKKISPLDKAYDTLINNLTQFLNESVSTTDTYCSTIIAYVLALNNQNNHTIFRVLLNNTMTHGDESYINIDSSSFNFHKKTLARIRFADIFLENYNNQSILSMHNIIATSYIALAYLKQNLPRMAQPFVKWLLKIQKSGKMLEEYDNAIALEAITEFAKISSKTSDIILGINDVKKLFVINSTNSKELQIIELENHSQTVTIKIDGKGFLIVKEACDTYTESTFDNEMFKINVETVKNARNIMRISLKINYTKPNVNTNEMILAEVQLPSGYVYDKSLNNYTTHPFIRVSRKKSFKEAS